MDLFQKRGIQWIISISFTAIAVIAMSFMGIVLYGQFAETSRTTMGNGNAQLLDQASINLNTYLKNMMRISDTMYYSVIKNKDLYTENLDREMTLLYEANKDSLVSVACLTEDGAVVSAAPIATRKENVDFKSQNWFVQANERIENLHFSTPHVQNMFENSNYRYYWVISLSRSVELTYMGQAKKGVLLVDMNFSGIEQLLAKANEKGSGYVYLIDGNGEIIYHPKKQMLNSDLLEDNNLVAAGYEDGEHTEKFQGEERAVIVKTVGYTGWKLVSVTPYSEFAVNLSKIRIYTVLIAALSIGLLIVGNMIISSKVVYPIRKLEDSIVDLEKGELDVNVFVGGTHEIQHLGLTIDSMVKRLKQLMEEMVREQEEKKKSALDALQSQINPHFLYNTLESVVWMIESERYKEAISMVTSLGSLFRISLSKGKNIIPIKDEIAHARYYLAIQKVRYKNKFEVFFEVDPEVEKYSTIKLIVQPILENAIYYGVEHMIDEGEIYVKAYTTEDDVCIEIIDNGMGIPEKKLETLLVGEQNTSSRKNGSGIGLKNIHQRIKLYFKGNYGLEIESELDEGTTVRIRLPKVLYEEKKQ